MSFNRSEFKTEDNCLYIKNEDDSSYSMQSPVLNLTNEEMVCHYNEPYCTEKDLNMDCKKHINSLQEGTEKNNNIIKIEKNYEANNLDYLMCYLKEEPEEHQSREEHLSSDSLKLKIECNEKIIKIEKEDVLEDNNVFENRIEDNERSIFLNENKYNAVDGSGLSSLLRENELDYNSNKIDENKSQCVKSIYICDICHESFTTKVSLRYHLKNNHSLRCFSNTLSKNVCSRSNKCDDQLLESSVKKTFKCKYCLLQFTDRSNCYRHIRNYCPIINFMNPNKKQWICTICMKTFGNRYSLKVHSRLHTGETPYKCEICCLEFNRNDVLKAHRKTHKNNVFYCNECRLHFSAKNTLSRHVKMKHLNEKRYTCEVCHLKFFRKDYLITHLKSKHIKERPYKCDICSKSYMEEKVLLTHKKSLHKEIRMRRTF